MNYLEFSRQESNKLVSVQNNFRNQFNIDNFENWFYDSELSLLRLYNNDEDEVYFQYIPVGTFSLKSKTWMWSWFNETSIEKNKTEILKIKEFGDQNKYEKLVEGSFPGDEYDAWEFTAICFNFLNGIGTYKVNSDNLEKYMVILSQVHVDSLLVKHFKQKSIECADHGISRPAYVCQHLDLKTPKGFKEAFDTSKGMELDEDDDFQAWCNACEEIRVKYNGWNEESEEFADIKLICENCYFEMKEINN